MDLWKALGKPIEGATKRNKQLEREIRKLNNQVIRSEKHIGELEAELGEMDKVLMDPEKHKEALSDPEVFKKYNAVKMNLEKEMGNWENLSLKLENLRTEKNTLKTS